MESDIEQRRPKKTGDLGAILARSPVSVSGFRDWWTSLKKKLGSKTLPSSFFPLLS